MLTDRQRDIATTVARAMKEDYLQNPHLVNVFSVMSQQEVRKFILDDLRESFSGTGYNPVIFKNLSSILELIARENSGSLGQFDVSSALNAAVNIASSVGSAYLQKKAAEDARKLARKSQELQEMQAKAEKAAQVAEAVKAGKEIDVKAEARTVKSKSIEIKPWMIMAGVGAVALIGMIAWRGK